MTEFFQNHLAGETSPYLLQHATNPVDWHPWSRKILQQAVTEDKLLVLSIGYAACHWCHVMEHESFRDPEVARLMNEHFISVKIDREERPDLDQVYMTACQLINGQGGWPLNVIALPDGNPVYAGTYFPKSSWMEVLIFFAEAYRNNPMEVKRSAASLAEGLKTALTPPGFVSEIPSDPAFLDELRDRVAGGLDPVNGGTRHAPKFPMPSLLGFLLRIHDQKGGERVRELLKRTLTRMAAGGIRDQAGGGFARYAVDERWHVPHFEKMLYDNAQLITVYARAWMRFREDRYRQAAWDAMSFIRRELTSPEGVFWSSVDADSEEGEGIYYAWTLEEILRVAGPSVASWFGATEEGNWEDGKNLLRENPEIPYSQRPKGIESGIRNLLTERSKRPRPATDTKVLTSWNALMISALVDFYTIFGEEEALSQARHTGTFYAQLLEPGNGLFRCYAEGRFMIAGFLDDYAFLASAFLDLYEATFEEHWLRRAEILAGEITERFRDPESGMYLLASKENAGPAGAAAELADTVLPSSNSVLARAFNRLGRLTGEKKWSGEAVKLLAKMLIHVQRDPLHHGNWAQLLADLMLDAPDISVVGDSWETLLKELRAAWIPGAVFSGGSTDLYPAVLNGKSVPGKTLIYICRRGTCLPPVQTAANVLDLIREEHS